MKRIKTAAVILLIHGIIEIMAIAGTFMAALTQSVDTEAYTQFIVPYFNENIVLMTLASLIYGVIRIFASIGLFKNRMWGLALAVICATVTLTLMMFVLPAGIMDGILAGTVLILLLSAYLGKKQIVR